RSRPGRRWCATPRGRGARPRRSGRPRPPRAAGRSRPGIPSRGARTAGTTAPPARAPRRGRPGSAAGARRTTGAGAAAGRPRERRGPHALPGRRLRGTARRCPRRTRPWPGRAPALDTSAWLPLELTALLTDELLQLVEQLAVALAHGVHQAREHRPRLDA